MTSLTQQESTVKHLGTASRSIKQAYSFADLSNYSLKERLMIRAGGLVFYHLVGVIGATVRFNVEGHEYLQAIRSGGHLPIFNIWHNRSFLGAYWLRQRHIAVLTSRSFDGEYIARLIQRFGFGAVRGSSTRGGVGAIVEMARLMRAGFPTGFTPDGPRGPLYEAKIGSVLLAKKTGHPLLPIMVTPERCWRLPSWDFYQIPKPFTRARVRIAAPIFVPADADDTMLEAKRKELQQALEQITE